MAPAAGTARQQRTYARKAGPAALASIAASSSRTRTASTRQQWFSPSTPTSPSGASTASTAPSLSPFDTHPSHKTPASRTSKTAAPHTNSPPSSVPNTMLPEARTINVVLTKRVRKPSVKAREMASLRGASVDSPDGLASVVGVRKRSFASSSSIHTRDDDPEPADDSPCIPRNKRARITRDESGPSTVVAPSPPFWVEVPLRSQPREVIKEPTSSSSNKSDMAAPLSTIPLRKQQQEKQQQEPMQLTRAVTPPRQMARNKSPPPPPASALRLANFDHSSRERRQHNQRHGIVRTAPGYEATPSGPSRLVDLSTSPSSSRNADGEATTRPSPIEFISPSQLGAILRDPNSSSSRTRTKDASSYLSKMVEDTSSRSTESRSRSRDMLKLALLGKDKISPQLPRLGPAFQEKSKGKGKARAIDPVSPAPSPLPTSSQPRSSPTNPLGADVEALQPFPASKPYRTPEERLVLACKNKYGDNFVSREGWPVDKWMELKTPERRQAAASRLQLEIFFGIREEDGRLGSSPDYFLKRRHAVQRHAEPLSKSSPVRQAEGTSKGRLAKASSEPDSSPPRTKTASTLTDKERFDFYYGKYGDKFATREGWSEERYLVLKSPERKRARAARAHLEQAFEKGTVEPATPIQGAGVRDLERYEFYRDQIPKEFITSYGWKDDGFDLFPNPWSGKGRAEAANLNLRSPPPGMSVAEWWPLRRTLPPRYAGTEPPPLELKASRDLPPTSFYAQNKREEMSPSPPSRRIVSERFEDVLKAGEDGEEEEKRETEEEDELDDEEEEEDGEGNDDDEEMDGEFLTSSDLDELEDILPGEDEEEDDGDIQKRRRRLRTYFESVGVRSDPPMPRLRKNRHRAADGSPETPLRQIKAGHKRRH
ncbi:hypothetical protein A4X13_0g5810 [Tilletia indica]|uniref:Uncharacterized protein n=1 Tax=Tilletia indica TaxID=43049 RepID=A0A177TG54_9BASI|nr:hypothetical protein A4X13_0g5810 [Tilletia indica]